MRRRLSVGLWALGLLAASCDLGGLQETGTSLLNPDSALLDSPGRRLAAGSFSGLRLDGSLDTGGSVLAFRADRGEPTMAIIPFLGGDLCELRPAVDFDRLASRVLGAPNKNLIAVQRTSDGQGWGRVSFVDSACQPQLEALENARIPEQVFPSTLAAEPLGLLSLDGAGTLRLVDPITPKLLEVARNVNEYSVVGEHLYTIEAGQLVIRNGTKKVMARLGRQVSSYTVTGGTEFELGFEDADGIAVWGTSGEKRLDPDGCAPVALGPDVVAYHAPCADRRLSVHLTGRLLGMNGAVTLRGPEQVVELGRVLASWAVTGDHSELTFLQAGTGGLRLRHAVIASDSQVPGGELVLDSQVIAENGNISGGQLYDDWADGVGTLLVLDQNEDGTVRQAVPVASRVRRVFSGSPFSDRGLLVDFDGRVGRLVRATRTSSGIELEEVATAVPDQQPTFEPQSADFALVANANASGTGQLLLIGGGAPEPVANDVLADSIRFMEQPRAVIYLARPQPDAPTELRAWLIKAELTLKIQEFVSEYQTVPWPAPGVLYVVSQGDEQGVWFSKAR